MQKLPTGDAFSSLHKTVQFWQFNDATFEAPFDEEDEEEYPVSLLFSVPITTLPLSNLFKSWDIQFEEKIVLRGILEEIQNNKNDANHEKETSWILFGCACVNVCDVTNYKFMNFTLKTKRKMLRNRFYAPEPEARLALEQQKTQHENSLEIDLFF